MAEGLKDRKLQAYYEAAQAMFETAGWKNLAEDLIAILDKANTLNGIASLTDLDFRRGQIDILNLVLAQPAVMSSAYQLLLDDEDEK